MWTGEDILDAVGFLVESLIQENYFARAVGTREDLAPDSVFDTAFCLAVRVIRFIHPPDFLFDFLKDLFPRTCKFLDIERQVIICSDEGCSRRQIVEYCSPGAPFGFLDSLASKIRLDLPSVLFRRRPAPLRCDPRHAGTTK